jgi:hypothetical protein
MKIWVLVGIYEDMQTKILGYYNSHMEAFDHRYLYQMLNPTKFEMVHIHSLDLTEATI